MFKQSLATKGRLRCWFGKEVGLDQCVRLTIAYIESVEEENKELVAFIQDHIDLYDSGDEGQDIDNFRIVLERLEKARRTK